MYTVAATAMGVAARTAALVAFELTHGLSTSPLGQGLSTSPSESDAPAPVKANAHQSRAHAPAKSPLRVAFIVIRRPLA
jgi:hypothetical protein